jgi:hypothetical protein
MLKYLTILVLLATPAHAWEFAPVPVCTLSHKTADLSVRITYDPEVPIYEMSVSLKSDRWPKSAAFSITFTGGHALRIVTDSHRLSQDRQTLSVSDDGFGNVLDGVQFNTLAKARAGTRLAIIPLKDAAPAVQRFRSCPAPGLS